MSRAGFDEQGRSMSRAVEGVSPTEFMGMGVKIRVKISRSRDIDMSFDRYTL
jgi:hypothetical protein